MAVKVKYILDALSERMPLALAEDYDNVGLLAGSRENPVTRALCALDVTLPVIEEAAARGAELIITHHPILFHGRKNLTEDDPEGAILAALVRSRINLIAMHTNYDSAENGVNDALASAIGLLDVVPLPGGVRLGWIAPIALSAFAESVSKALGGSVRRYGRAGEIVSRVAVLGGAGGSYGHIARAAWADTFVTGEIGYHTALDLYAGGLRVLEAGHAATEWPAVRHMAGIIRMIPGLEIDIFESAIVPFL